MNTIYLDSKFYDEKRRKQLYDGQLFRSPLVRVQSPSRISRVQ